ncbi:MAG: hypothetical protein U0Q18_24165 [Bryobacteraceae bacterium]
MPSIRFGNDPAKIARYRAFWNREDAGRPLVGFTKVGWFPLGEFAVARKWTASDYLTPDMVDPADLIEDHLRILREGEQIDDDMIRGACPGQAAIPWLPAMLGCALRILPENILGVERQHPWEELEGLRLNHENPWFRKYLDFATLLAEAAQGSFPVSHSPEIGPTDLHAVMRGHTASLVDLNDEPEKSAELLWRCGEIFRELTEELWKRVPLFHGGFFDAQYCLWSPGPIVRMQEDATAVYSPRLYRRFVQPVDRMLAAHFASSFIHLHSTSLFLLDAFLEIDEIQCYEVNRDVLGPAVPALVPFFQRIQKAGKPLLIRGSLQPDDVRLLLDSLDRRGLFLNIMITDLREVEPIRKLLRM